MTAAPKTAFVFPGQGSQNTSMIEPFHAEWDGVDDALDDIGDETTRELVFEADAPTLKRTVNAQQAVFTVGLAVSRVLQRRFDCRPDVTAGHSLGHITAATEAGVLTPADGLELVRHRGSLMADAEQVAGPGTMYAVLFLETAVVESIVSDVADVTVAGRNSERQTVISGPTDGVEAAVDEIDAHEDRSKTVELDVESGFHSPVMEPAVEPFSDVVDRLEFRDPTVPVVSDVTGETYRSGETAAAHLPRQLTSCVEWESVVRTLEGLGVDRIVVLPPAEDVTRLVERNVEDVEVVSVTSTDLPALG